MTQPIRPLTLPVHDDLLQLLHDFDCVRDDEDSIAHEVNAFIRGGDYEEGTLQGLNTTYVMFDREADPQAVVAYVSVSVDSVRLTDGEKKNHRVDFPDFGALKIVMIGSDCRHKGNDYGKSLLKAVIGIAKDISDKAALRFVVADANNRAVGWYEEHGFLVNRATKQQSKDERTTSMRYDLHAEDLA